MTANVKAVRVDGKSWHGREIEFSEGYVQLNERPTDVMKAIKTIGIETVKAPMFVEINDVKYETSDSKLVLTNVPWNESGYEILNRNVSHYKPIQNRDLATIFDTLVPTYQLATVGNIGVRGQISFIEFKDGEYTIGGNDNELHKAYFLIGDNKEANGTYFGYVTTRVVCENTWNMAISGIRPIPHSNDSVAVLGYIAHIQQEVTKHRQYEIQMLNKMFTTKMKTGDMNTLTQMVFPDPKKSGRLKLFENTKDYQTEEIEPLVEKETNLFEKAVERVEKRRQGLVDEYFRFNDENSQAAQSVYAGWNAVTGYINHSDDFNGQGVDVVANLMFGNRAEYQSNAWKACVGLVK